MPRRDWGQLVKAFLASLAFIGAGLFTRWAGAPGLVVWPLIVFGGVGLAAAVYGAVKPISHSVAPNTDEAGTVALRDGRDYRVEFSDADFALVHKASGEVHTMA